MQIDTLTSTSSSSRISPNMAGSNLGLDPSICLGHKSKLNYGVVEQTFIH